MPTQLFSVVFLLVLTSLATSAQAASGGNIFQATLLEADQQIPEVSTEELRTILAEKRALVFDARPVMEYAVSHIPGALNVSAKPGVPMSELEA